MSDVLKCDCVLSSAEALEGIDLGETTHKKPGTTVPESIHSFSESPPRPPFVSSARPQHWKPLIHLWKLVVPVDAGVFGFVSVGDGLVQPEALNKKAIQIINRVRDKLTGESAAFTQESSFLFSIM